MKNEQFNEFMSLFGVNQINQTLRIQQDQEILELDNTKRNILSQKDLDLSIISEQLKGLMSTEEIIYKLSNEFMAVGSEGKLPYDKVMTLPTNEKWTNILLLVKTISTVNRLYLYHNQDTPVITGEMLAELGYNITIEQLQKVLELLGSVRINQTKDGIQVNFDALWSHLPLKGAGYIKYDMSKYRDKIDKAQEYLEKTQASFHDVKAL